MPPGVLSATILIGFIAFAILQTRRSPRVDLERDEGEEILSTTRRHWVVLLRRSFIFLIIGVVSAELSNYRAQGGAFFVTGVDLEGRFDLINTVLLGFIALLGFFWWRLRRRKPKKPPLGLPYLLGIGVLGLAFYFRFQGGRLLYINRFDAAGADALNVALMALAFLSIPLLIYIVIDWADDFLILTNTRVVYEDRQAIPVLSWIFPGLFLRHVQQQMMISDIQQINYRSETYREYWLGLKPRPAYGTVVIRSFSPRSLIFRQAIRPQIVQEQIQTEVGKLRRQQEPELLRKMIEDQVYGNKPPKSPGPAIQVVERAGPIPWLFPPNPHIDYEREIVVWRPDWVFMALQLMRPIGVFALISIVLTILYRLDVLGAQLSLALALPVLLFCLGWIVWIREEHENDKYILSRQSIIDIDKKPFGPESRRQASLGNIQDISYDVGFVESILGYGDVIVKTGGAAGGDFTFNHVPDPRGVHATINDYLTDFKKRDKERQLQDSLALVKQYHLLQAEHGELLDGKRIAAAVDERIAAQIAAPLARNAQNGAAQQARTTHHDIRAIVRGELWQILRRRRRRD